MATTVQVAFNATNIKNGSFRFKSDVSQTTQTAVGCTGKIEGSTEMSTIQRKCGREVQKYIAKPISHTVKLTGQFRADFIRKIFGLSNEGLKAGVLAYGPGAKPEPFLFTVNTEDEFEGNEKLMAFPELTVLNGYAYSYDKGQDTFDGVELELAANLDENNKWFYEMFKGEGDTALYTDWHTKWTPTLMKLLV